MFSGLLTNGRCQKFPWNSSRNSLPCWFFCQNIPSLLELPLETTSTLILENVAWKPLRMSPFGEQPSPSQGHTCSRRGWGLPPLFLLRESAEFPGRCSRDRVSTGIRTWMSCPKLSPVCSQLLTSSELRNILCPWERNLIV